MRKNTRNRFASIKQAQNGGRWLAALLLAVILVISSGSRSVKAEGDDLKPGEVFRDACEKVFEENGTVQTREGEDVTETFLSEMSTSYFNRNFEAVFDYTKRNSLIIKWNVIEPLEREVDESENGRCEISRALTAYEIAEYFYFLFQDDHSHWCETLLSARANVVTDVSNAQVVSISNVHSQMDAFNAGALWSAYISQRTNNSYITMDGERGSVFASLDLYVVALDSIQFVTTGNEVVSYVSQHSPVSLFFIFDYNGTIISSSGVGL